MSPSNDVSTRGWPKGCSGAGAFSCIQEVLVPLMSIIAPTNLDIIHKPLVTLPHHTHPASVLFNYPAKHKQPKHACDDLISSGHMYLICCISALLMSVDASASWWWWAHLASPPRPVNAAITVSYLNISQVKTQQNSPAPCVSLFYYLVTLSVGGNED